MQDFSQDFKYKQGDKIVDHCGDTYTVLYIVCQYMGWDRYYVLQNQYDTLPEVASVDTVEDEDNFKLHCSDIKGE